jgi:butyrate kinase
MKDFSMILIINPGSTSTKVALFKNNQLTNEKDIIHSAEEISKYTEVNDQLDMRTATVNSYLQELNFEPSKLSAVAVRGGTFGYAKGGAYLVDEKLIEACKNPLAPHASNLAAQIGYAIGNPHGINTYIYDAVCVDEAEDMVKITGMPEITRQMFTHVLNSRAVAIKVAKDIGKDSNDLNFIVIHMGGGISVNLIKNGRFADIVSDDEGTFSPERTGRVGERNLVKMCFRSGLSEKEMQKKVRGNGGLVAYLGTTNAIEVEKMIAAGDKKAEQVYYAMAYQIAKDIGSLAAAANGDIDYIIITGGIAHSEMMTGWIKEKVQFIAPVKIVPGTFEMEALAQGIQRVLNKEEAFHTV